MRILFLTKRFYTGKDLIGECYGRMFELPRGLAGRGHEVLGLALAYRDVPDEALRVEPSGPRWMAFGLGRGLFPGLWRYFRGVRAEARHFAPDVVVAGSDAPHVIFGAWLAARLRVPFVADLYDDFESFSLTAVPGVLPLFKRAVRRADGVACVSHALVRHVGGYRPRGTVEVVENGVDRSRFHPRDPVQARRELGLPLEGRLIGTAGALQGTRGISALYDAFRVLAEEDEELHLVLAGPIDDGLPPPNHPRVCYLGTLSHERVAWLFAALDVAVVCNLDSAFGRHCFPQKLHEILACGTPVVAAAVGDAARLLADTPSSLYMPGSAESLAARLREQLATPARPGVAVLEWDGLAERLEGVLARVVRS